MKTIPEAILRMQMLMTKIKALQLMKDTTELYTAHSSFRVWYGRVRARVDGTDFSLVCETEKLPERPVRNMNNCDGFFITVYFSMLANTGL